MPPDTVVRKPVSVDNLGIPIARIEIEIRGVFVARTGFADLGLQASRGNPMPWATSLSA